ncbi:MAG: fumarylacetoacetase [Bryobacteraceae bacterium]
MKSWVTSANDPGTDFPIENLPFGSFRRSCSESAARIGVAIGDQVLDLTALLDKGLIDGEAAEACREPVLNSLMALGHRYCSGLRSRLAELLRADFSGQGHIAQCLVPIAEAELLLPVGIGDYTDFYASIHHATNVGRLFRPDNPLLPNYKYVPIGYHGRASSVVISGTGVRRPSGQTKSPQAETPEFGPSKRLDYELEAGFFVGRSNQLGSPIPIEKAEDHLFGLCLVNDWSARDIQAWEYQPLGPFLAKSFATTISPWVVTAEALAPFRVPAFNREPGDPEPLEYLRSHSQDGGIEITLEVYLQSGKMRNAGHPPVRLSRGNFRDMYWTISQLITHHASNGCNLRTGDLMASGTVSGSSDEARGCLLELTRGGAEPIQLPGGETRRFLEDGDEVIFHGHCQREGVVSIGFGECRGRVIG